MVDCEYLTGATCSFDWPLHLRLAATVGALGLNVHLISGFLFATFSRSSVEWTVCTSCPSRGGSLRYSHSYLKVGVWAVLFTEAAISLALGWHALASSLVLASACLQVTLVLGLQNLQHAFSRNLGQSNSFASCSHRRNRRHSAQTCVLLTQRSESAREVRRFCRRTMERGRGPCERASRLQDLEHHVRSHFVDEVIDASPISPWRPAAQSSSLAGCLST